MRRLGGRMGLAVLLLACGAVVLLASGSPFEAGSPGGGPPESPPGLDRDGAPTDNALLRLESIELGRHVFFNETFDGNGRTCATCHQPRDAFAITPALVEARFNENPDDPLFRAIDSDDGDGESFFFVRNFALFRVNLQLHPNIRVAGQPLQRTIRVFRSVPAITNLALSAPFQWDGRFEDLVSQARGAIDDHFEAGRPARPKELRALVRFQETLFTPQSLESLLDEDDPIPKQPGFSLRQLSPAATKGRQQFELHCSSCHSGELANEPTFPIEGRFQSNFVSQLNRPGLPLLNLIFSNPDGTETLVSTPDPGLAAQTGRLGDLNKFEIAQLRGIKHTAPYFHDNSAKDLREVIEHYNLTFGLGTRTRQIDELIAFLEGL